MASSSRIPLEGGPYSAVDGSSLAGLAGTATWIFFKNVSDGSARTPQPTIRDDGLGAYTIAHGLSAGEAFYGRIDWGPTASPRTLDVSCRYEDTLGPDVAAASVALTFTYSDALTLDRDKVRFALGDTDDADPLLSDNEIAYLLTRRSSVQLAAADGAEKIAAKFSRKADFTNGKNSVSASQRAKAYRDLAAQLRREARELGGMTPFFGGQTISGKTTLREDSDAVQPGFSVDQDQLPGNAPAWGDT